MALDRKFSNVGGVQRHIDSAYDNIKKVADNLDALLALADSFDNLNGEYQGQLAADPTTRTDLSPLQPGDHYFNTSSNLLYFYIDGSWVYQSVFYNQADLDTALANGPHFTWIAYADDNIGTGISEQPGSKEWIGFATGQTTDVVDIGDPGIFDWSKIKGLDGSDGADGVDGSDGAAGAAGAAGADGADGSDGSAGLKGDKGDTGDTGPQGLQGIQGPAGANGTNGIDGIDGNDGATGPQGPQGIQGPAGPTGATGATGATGPAGAAGAAGSPGLKGDTGAKGDTGDTGPAGADGATGAQGPTGATGADGVAGPTGPQGPQGIKGDIGATGATGPQGPAGPAGSDGSDGADGVVDIDPPDTPTGVTSYILSESVRFTWTVPSYSGHDYTKVYKTTWDGVTPPAFNVSHLFASVQGDFLDLGLTRDSDYYYWFRHVNLDGTESTETGGYAVHTADGLEGTDDWITINNLDAALEARLNLIDTTLIDGYAGIEGALQNLTTEHDTLQLAFNDVESDLGDGVSGLIKDFNDLNAAYTITAATVGDNMAGLVFDVDAMESHYFVKFNNNGHISGFGLSSTPATQDDPDHADVLSQFAVLADEFIIAHPDATESIPFYVESGSTYITEAFVKELTAAKIIAGTIAANQIYIGSDLFELDGNVNSESKGALIIQNAAKTVELIRLGYAADGASIGLFLKDHAGTDIFTAGTTLAGDLLNSGTVWADVSGTTDAPDDNATRDVYTGDWATSTSYIIGDLVLHEGTIYRCILGHTSSGANEPVNATYWAIHIAGALSKDLRFKASTSGVPATPTAVNDPSGEGWSDDVPGTGGTVFQSYATKDGNGDLVGTWSTPTLFMGRHRGTWASSTTYFYGDMVLHNGSTFICVDTTAAGISGASKDPEDTPTANVYWDVLAAKGDQGDEPTSFDETLTVTATDPINLRTLADNHTTPYDGVGDATWHVTVDADITADSSTGYAIDTGDWPSGITLDLDLTIATGHKIRGRGGNGGNGGSNGNSGQNGDDGGDAIYCREDIDITIESSAEVSGGSGGGGGGAAYHDDDEIDPPATDGGGGGGGGGWPLGNGGAGGTEPEGNGTNGGNATASAPGNGGGGHADGRGGGQGGNDNSGYIPESGDAGTSSTGDYGQSGGSAGSAGYAIRHNGNTVNVTNNGSIGGTNG